MREQSTLSDWLSWRPSSEVATANPANIANDASPSTPPLAELAKIAVAADRRSYLWQIVEGGRAREVVISGCPSFAEVREWYPRAWLTPITSLSGTLPRPVWANETELRSWLAEVGETDADIITQLLRDYRRWSSK